VNKVVYIALRYILCFMGYHWYSGTLWSLF